MRKYKILFFTIVLLIIPLFVSAETCDSTKINLVAITIKDQSKNAEEIEKASIIDNNINLNIKFKDIDDYIIYDLFIQNNSEEDYLFDTSSIQTSSDYIEYHIETENNLVKANEGKIIELKVSYRKEVQATQFIDGTYQDNKTVSLRMATGEQITNPETGRSHIIFSITCIILGISLIVTTLRSDKKVSIPLTIFLLCSFIPARVLAACQYSIQINANVIIEQKEKKYCVISGEGTKDSRLDGLNIIKKEYNLEELNSILESVQTDTYTFMKKEDIESKKETKDNLLSIEIGKEEKMDSSVGCYIMSIFGEE